MAFATSALQDVGGFDPTLGTGTKALGGDDLSVFFKIIMGGYQLVYQPTALVHHRHRRDYAALRRQAFGYGVGLTAYLTKSLLDRPQLFFDFLTRIPYGLSHLFSAESPKNAKKSADFPKELTLVERMGMIYGPVCYLRSLWESRKIRQQFVQFSNNATMSASPVSSPDGVAQQ